jgi:hypothetical protein
MNYMYSPGVLAGTHVPSQPTLLPQGVIGTQFGQLAGGILGQFLPGPFGAIASQLLPQFGNLLPFQAGPQAAYVPQGVIGNPWGHLAGGIAGQIPQAPFGGIAPQWIPQGPFGGITQQWMPQAGAVLPFQAGPQAAFVPQSVIGSPLGHLAAGIGGQILPGPFGGIGSQLPFGGIGSQLPFGGIGSQFMPQAGTVMPYQAAPQTVFLPQGVIGGQLGQLAGGLFGHVLPGPFGAIASQLLPQIGSVLLPFQAGPQQSVPMGGYGLNQPFVSVGVQW